MTTISPPLWAKAPSPRISYWTPRVKRQSLSFSPRKRAPLAVSRVPPFVVQLCSHPAVTQGPELLRGAALAALTRFMVLDAQFCEDHLKLIFSRLKVESDKGTPRRYVALGDLAFRFPNAVEPWTEHLYGVKEWGNSLHDPDASVRQHAITVLSHLVLNDMMKVKGHISEMARCLEDADRESPRWPSCFSTSSRKSTETQFTTC